MRHVDRKSIHGVYAALLVLGLTMVAADATAACRGAWAEGVQYAAGDTVTYNGTVYTALVGHGCNGCGWILSPRRRCGLEAEHAAAAAGARRRHDRRRGPGALPRRTPIPAPAVSRRGFPVRRTSAAAR